MASSSKPLPDPAESPEQATNLAAADAKAFIKANRLGTDQTANTPNRVSNQAILLSNGIHPVTPKRVAPRWLYIAVAAALLMALGISYVATRPNGSSSDPGTTTGVGVPQAPGASTSQGLDNQIQKDVKSCSNVVNAALSC